MNRKDIQKSIIKAVDSYFVGKANGARIKEIEYQLGVVLPDSYKWFLMEFGHGGVSGFEIFGNGLGETASCVRATIRWRKFGLPSFFVVVEDEGTDWIYCLDTSRFSLGECPVIDWTQGVGIGKEYFESFEAFFEKRFEESLSVS